MLVIGVFHIATIHETGQARGMHRRAQWIQWEVGRGVFQKVGRLDGIEQIGWLLYKILHIQLTLSQYEIFTDFDLCCQWSRIMIAVIK